MRKVLHSLLHPDQPAGHQQPPPPQPAQQYQQYPAQQYQHINSIPRNSIPRNIPIPTNAFYTNLHLGSQSCSAWTHPYSLSWAKGSGNASSWGMAVAHTEPEVRAYGPPGQGGKGESQYYINPIGIQSTVMGLEGLEAGSVDVCFAPGEGKRAVMRMPLVQGMGFVTALYSECTPLIQSSVFFRDMQPAGTINGGTTSKYRLILEDGKTWLLYITHPSHPGPIPLHKDSNTTIRGPASFTGTIQVAKLPASCPEDAYDSSAGAYATSRIVSGTANGAQGTYSFSWTKGGLDRPLLMFALPHHVASFDGAAARGVTSLKLQTTTKGVATGVVGDRWGMEEGLPVSMGFGPAGVLRLAGAGREAVIRAARSEVEQEVHPQCCLDSMYFSGKGLGKFAMMAYAVGEMAGEMGLAAKVLEKLKRAFAVFVENKQPHPLVYDTTWKGVVSSAGCGGDCGTDFGNTWYNDHHFHYGYFVYTAAVIGHFDPQWLQDARNRNWVNMLVRDFANPVADAQFPFSRSFDWFHGHSWAKGIFESADGKDQESTSEDVFASYALKMWGAISGDRNMEARGNLMLAVQARTFPTYFLMEDSNTVQPRQIVGNKVTGILFENKVDHATYFGMNPEYIQGIHMIPLSTPSAMIRSATFVREEWEAYFSNRRADCVEGGWRGILYANLAAVDAKAAFSFFDQPGFDAGWLDGGASRTWYLAYCAALGGA
ncbi:endo-1,3-beta-glucanase Engl1 [Trichodelitschia bisporula]|uniref:glucan endo-1,3-beta-D-glucosidase n=1 Tax=Trichodelitschia bisporula TaxID=703511 RepID=A0A6G1HXR0_9PEZI|nr:endo-1,3-beta-glucanase Engl1 [Trichodelitschia bisporula]